MKPFVASILDPFVDGMMDPVTGMVKLYCGIYAWQHVVPSKGRSP